MDSQISHMLHLKEWFRRDHTNVVHTKPCIRLASKNLLVCKHTRMKNRRHRHEHLQGYVRLEQKIAYILSCQDDTPAQKDKLAMASYSNQIWHSAWQKFPTWLSSMKKKYIAINLRTVAQSHKKN